MPNAFVYQCVDAPPSPTEHRTHSQFLLIAFEILSFSFNLEDILPSCLAWVDPLCQQNPCIWRAWCGWGRWCWCWNCCQGSCSMFYTPDKPQRNSWRCPSALARGGHRREPQLTGVRTPLFSLAVQAHSPRDVALRLQAFIWYEGSPLTCPVFLSTGSAAV